MNRLRIQRLRTSWLRRLVLATARLPGAIRTAGPRATPSEKHLRASPRELHGCLWAHAPPAERLRGLGFGAPLRSLCISVIQVLR